VSIISQLITASSVIDKNNNPTTLFATKKGGSKLNATTTLVSP
jgi:hypothetical protein